MLDVFPADRKFWTPFQACARPGRPPTEILASGLPPGDYLVAALTDGNKANGTIRRFCEARAGVDHRHAGGGKTTTQTCGWPAVVELLQDVMIVPPFLVVAEFGDGEMEWGVLRACRT